MKSSKSRLDALPVRLATLLGTASFLTISNAIDAYAQGEVVAQAEEIPETVLITGSLIRGTAAVGVPVTNLSPKDFATDRRPEHRRSLPVLPRRECDARSGVATNSGANDRTGHESQHSRPRHRHGDTFAVDGRRHAFPGTRQRPVRRRSLDHPGAFLDHIDVLVDGASATYGSDAISGVINIILKRNMDGAITQVALDDGRRRQEPLSCVRCLGPDLGRRPDHAELRVVQRLADPWETSTPNSAWIIAPGASMTGGRSARRLPAHPSTGRPAAIPAASCPIGTNATVGHGCTNCYAIPLGMGQNWDPGASGVGPAAPSSAATFDWSDVQQRGQFGHERAQKPVRSLSISPGTTRTRSAMAAHITVDQRLTSNISFYGSGFYSNRRATLPEPGQPDPAAKNIITGSACRHSTRTTRRMRRPICASATISAGKARPSPVPMSWRSAINWDSISRFPAIGAAASGTR